jgi:hypothetical protein
VNSSPLVNFNADPPESPVTDRSVSLLENSFFVIFLLICVS